jgi:hypothetical protein
MILLYDNDAAKDVAERLRADFNSTVTAVIDITSKDLKTQISECAKAIYDGIHSAFDASLNISLFCLLDETENFRLAPEAHIYCCEEFTSIVYMDTLLVGKQGELENFGQLSGLIRDAHGFCIYFVHRRPYKGIPLRANDLRNIGCDIIERRLNGEGSDAGLYVIRVASGSIRRFSLFKELAVRQNREQSAAVGAVDVNGIDNLIRETGQNHLRNINRDAFRYLPWQNLRFSGGKYPSPETYMLPPFSDYINSFIRLNCAGGFDEYMASVTQSPDELFNNFFWRAVSDKADDVFGDEWIALLEEVLDGLRSVKQKLQDDLADAETKMDMKPRPAGNIGSLWDYSDYMYSVLFQHKISAMRYKCLLEYTELLIETMDERIHNESQSNEKFKKELTRDLDPSDTFSNSIYDCIHRLFKDNPDANAYLKKRMRYYISNTTPDRVNQRYEAIINAESYARFILLVNESGERVFNRDSVKVFKNDVKRIIDEKLSEPIMLLSESFNSVKSLLQLSDCVKCSFTTLESPDTGVLFLMCEYFDINYKNPDIAEGFNTILKNI